MRVQKMYLYSIKIKGDNTMTKLQRVQEFNRLVSLYVATKNVKYYQQAMAINF